MSLAYQPPTPVAEYRTMARETRLRIELPDHERGATEFDLRELDRINARLAKPYKKAGGKSAEELRDADLARRMELEAKPALRQAQREVKAGLAESANLAAGRGEEVAEDRSGVKRILDRDPLLSLARLGHLTPEQLETGEQVRSLYDSRAADAGAMEYTGMPSGAHNHEQFIAARFTRAKASEMLGRIERAIVVHCRDEPETLNVLRWVCEHSRTLSAMDKAKGRAFARHCAALAKALDLADDVLKRRA